MLSSLEIRIGSARSAPNLTASHMLAVSPKTLWSSREMWIMERENRSRNWIWMTTTVVNKNLIHLLAHIQWMWNIMLRINRDDDDCRDFELQLYYSLLNVQPRPSSSDSTKKKFINFIIQIIILCCFLLLVLGIFQLCVGQQNTFQQNEERRK